MALDRIAIPADAARDKKAAELVKTAHTWDYVTLNKPWGSFPVGTECRLTPNGYYVNAVACLCPDYQQAGNICKHIRAFVLLEQRQPIREVRGRYEDLFPACPCGDIADSQDGLCDRCASDREYRQQLARKREILANL